MDLQALDPTTITLPSPLPNVSDKQWTAFARVMMTARSSAVSQSNALGAFEFTAKRLADFGLVEKLKHTKSKKSGRTIWKAVFIAPLTTDAFLKNLSLQYRVFMTSMLDYNSKIYSNTVKIPEGATLSGTLAVLQRVGPNGLRGEMFPATKELFTRANGIF
jgi:hypothetical protein